MLRVTGTRCRPARGLKEGSKRPWCSGLPRGAPFTASADINRLHTDSKRECNSRAVRTDASAEATAQKRPGPRREAGCFPNNLAELPVSKQKALMNYLMEMN